LFFSNAITNYKRHKASTSVLEGRSPSSSSELHLTFCEPQQTTTTDGHNYTGPSS